MGLLDFFKRNSGEQCAQRVGLEVGLLSRCPVCGDVLDNDADDAAWDRAVELIAEAGCGDEDDVLVRLRRQVAYADIDCACDRS